MKVLVCGGRDFDRRSFAYKTLDKLHKEHNFDLVIQGDARGADTIGRDWAFLHGINVRTFSANWEKYGKRAGMIRNSYMLKEGEPDLVIAFPGGNGTANMVMLARRANVNVIEVKE